MDDFAKLQSSLVEIELLSQSAASAEAFSADVVKVLAPHFTVTTMLFFLPFDEDTLEFKISYGRPYANLEEGRFLKTNRKTPVTDAIRHQKPQVWGNSKNMLLEYPDLVLWPKIMPAVVAIPIVENGKSIAGCVFILGEEFPKESTSPITDALGFSAHLIYQVYLRQGK